MSRGSLIRIFSPGKTCGYPYPVCKKNNIDHGLPVCKGARG